MKTFKFDSAVGSSSYNNEYESLIGAIANYFTKFKSPVLVILTQGDFVVDHLRYGPNDDVVTLTRKAFAGHSVEQAVVFPYPSKIPLCDRCKSLDNVVIMKLYIPEITNSNKVRPNGILEQSICENHSFYCTTCRKVVEKRS